MMLKEIKVLSIQQPWAWLIVNGHKDIENRNWSTKYRGKFYVHAGKTIDRGAIGYIENRHRIYLPDEFETGGIVGEAELVDCVTSSESKWFLGKYGFVLQNAKRLDFLPLRGQLGFFKIK